MCKPFVIRMLTVELFNASVKLPGAFDFDLLLREAESLVNSTGTVVYRGAAPATATGADVASYRIYQAVIDDVSTFQRAWRGLGRAVKLSWRGVAVSVATEVMFELMRQRWEEIGIGEGLEIMADAANEPSPREPGRGTRTRFQCGWKRDDRSKLMTFKAFEERRYSAAVRWLEMPGIDSAIASGIGVLKVYKALAESMLLAMVAAYTATELQRGAGAGKVKTKRVRARGKVRGPGRPRKDSPDAPRRKGQWRKKHPEPR